MHVHLRFFLAVVLAALSLTVCGTALPPAAPQATATIDTATIPTPEAPTPTAVPASLPTSEPTTMPSAAAPTKDLYAMGDTAALDPFHITVNRAEATEADLGESKAGHRFVILDVTLENIAGTDQDVALLTQLFVEDATGATYTVDPGASLSAVMTLNGSINAGEQATGVVGYQVPEAAQGLRLIFRTANADASAEAGRVVFDLEQ